MIWKRWLLQVFRGSDRKKNGKDIYWRNLEYSVCFVSFYEHQKTHICLNRSFIKHKPHIQQSTTLIKLQHLKQQTHKYPMPKSFHHLLALFFSLLITQTLTQQQLLQQQTKQQILTTVQYKYLIFTTHCYDSFFHHNDWFNFECLKITAAKLIGYSLVMGGAIIKFPQIIKIIGRKSVLGISFVSVILQLSSNILASGYCIYKGNPFSLYGENVFIGVQMLVIILLFVLFGTGNKIVYLVSFVGMIAAAYFITDPENIPAFVVENSIIVQSLLICTSRMSQINEVFRLKSTGSLALITWALSLLGNIGRIATIMVQASNDHKFLLSIVTVAILNATIVFQFYWYPNPKPKSQQKTD